MPAPQAIIELVERFRRNLKDYQSGNYNETQVRREFIDPFFEALGWDVNNKKGYAEAYKDVVHEDQVKVGGATKAPDYGFRIGGTRKFFVEAKKPSVNIRDDVHPAYQLRRYAWSAKLSLSILTDFEELAVYDCRIRPVKTDKSGAARVMYFSFADYVEKWDEIAAVFAREAVLQGSFDRYAESKLGKRGTAEVDAAFLAEIERWRDTLARNIALRNPGLSVRDLNFAVQRTIDRIIFLRIAEDRGLEPYGQLRNIGEQKDSYEALCRLYLRADERYNSGLFHFKAEKERPGEPDEFTPNLKVDEKVIDSILRNLYYPDSPYEFSVLPADILGQVYEQFLGKVIRLTAGGQAKVEDKPEVKKAGGVYYTPTYIVDYIVAQTVGKLLEGKTPNSAAHLKICDPACGSGSFLLGAFQYLLNWHRDFYVSDGAEKWARKLTRGLNPLSKRGMPVYSSEPLYQGPGGEWRLTTAEKRRILLNNIYGVDIDPQAVEVTKLSLLLKVLEGENAGSLGQMAFFQERALPDLDNNIKCGNSLIGPDFYTGQQLTWGSSTLPPSRTRGLSPLFSTEEMYRINAFDWQAEFPRVFDLPPRLLWFVTFVTHNSRVSERMVTYGVKRGDPVILNAEERFLMAEKIIETCQKHGIPIVSLNILPDHVHMVIPADDETELNEFVRKIKGGSSFAFQRGLDWPQGSHIWAQKFHRKPITDQQALHAIMEYIENNALKHAQTWGDELIDEDKGLKPLVAAASVNYEAAIRAPGGFDAVIGNPPYVRQECLGDTKTYFQSRYKTYKPTADLYVNFIEKGLSLINPTGLFGMIISNKWLRAAYGKPLREYLLEHTTIHEVVDFAGLPVFPNATVRTIVMICSPRNQNKPTFKYLAPVAKEEFPTISDGRRLREIVNEKAFDVTFSGLSEDGWAFSSVEKQAIIAKLQKHTQPLIKFVDGKTYFGIKTGLNAAFVVDRNTRDKLIQEDPRSSEVIKPMLTGRDVRRYIANFAEKYLIWTPIGIRIEQYPAVFNHLKQFQTELQKRWDKGNHWWELRACDYYDLFKQPKIIYPDIATSCRFALDTEGFFGVNTTYFIPGDDLYLLGILNSKVSHFYLSEVCAGLEGSGSVYLRFFGQYLGNFPVQAIDFSNPAEAAQHDRMVALVESMLALHKQLAAAKIPSEKQMLQRQIDTTDKQIDALVYELYGLTEEEIKIVEGAV